MATDKKSSVLVESSLPEFLQDEGPKFVAFVKAYYEWLETTNQVTDRAKNLLNYGDIDNTDDEFLKYFQREVLSDIPETILADKRLLIQRIKDLYRSKGSEKAYSLLFRLLYDEEIEFYYPGNDILIASDGRWVQQQSVRLSAPFVGDPSNFGGAEIVGVTSGATARVQRVSTTIETGVDIFELFLAGVNGTFVDAETVRNTSNTISGRIISSVGPLQQVNIQFGGAGHISGDRVSFTSVSGAAANGFVSTTVDTSITPTIVDGGDGYTTNSIITLSGGSGTGAEFIIDSISDTETIGIYDDIVADLRDTRLDANTYISSNTGAISANLAVANVSSIIGSSLGTSNLVVGTIASMSAVTRGSGYATVPSVSIRQDNIADQALSDGSGGIKGFNAVVLASSVPGSISSVVVDNAGSGYIRSDLITVTNLTSSNTENATGSGIVTGVINNPGKYTDTKGFLSWNNRLQDNFYYQKFSYVLRSKQSVETYRELVKRIIHPAGIKTFGDLRIEANIAAPYAVSSYTQFIIENVTTPAISSTVTFGDPRIGYSIGPLTSIVSTAVVNPVELVRIIGPAAITSTAVVSNTVVLLNIGGADINTIPSSLVVPSDLQVLQVGQGTMTNFIANNIADLSGDQIADYDALTIDALPGNRIFDGFGTAFDTQLAGGSTVYLLDVNNTSQEITIVVSSIDDANTLAVSSNVVYSNGDIALISNGTFLYAT